MSASTISVVDVGHGNCSVLRDNNRVALFDAGHKVHVIEYLKSENISDIDLVVISHSDADHLEGLVALLATSEFKVKKIVVKPDATKESKLWNDFCALVDALSRKHEVVVLNDPDFSDWNSCVEGAQLEYISPSVYLALRGAGSEYAPTGTPQGVVTSNSASIVVRVKFNGVPMVLITGDMDQIALSEIERTQVEVSALILIFPHHGGRPGSASIEDFTNRLFQKVKPEYVLFSIGRGRHDTPRPEILKHIGQEFSGVRALCTQLSMHCCDNDQMQDSERELIKYAGGKGQKTCCSGTVEFDLVSGKFIYPKLDDHSKFVETLPSPLCRLLLH